MRLRQLRSNKMRSHIYKNTENQSKIFFSILVLLYVAVSVLVVFVPERYRTYELSLLLGQSVMIVPFTVYAFMTRGKVFRSIPLCRLSFGNVLLLILLTVLILPVMMFLNAVSMLFTENTVSNVLDSVSSHGILLNLLLVAVLPCVFEELTFRGIIYQGWREKNIFRGILLSGLMFGMFHMNVNQFFYAFFVGVVMALVVEATGSIFATMLIHFLINGQSVLLVQVQKLLDHTRESVQGAAGYEEISKTGEVLSAEFLVLLGIGAVIFGILAVRVFRWLCCRCGTLEHVRSIFRGQKTEHIEEETQKKLQVQTLLANGAWLLAMAICIGLMILNGQYT